MRWLVTILVATVVAASASTGCRGGYRDVKVVDEMDLGTCPRDLKPGESCEVGARDFSAGLSGGAPRSPSDGDAARHATGTAWFRWPLFDAELDWRPLQRGETVYQSIAGGLGTHLRPMLFWPAVQRYVDPVIDGGFDLGVVKKDSHLEARGDGYLAAAIDVYAPDFGPLRYTRTGVPGLRLGVRYTDFVNGWASDTTFEVGVIWRWGVPIDLYHHWTTQRLGD